MSRELPSRAGSLPPDLFKIPAVLIAKMPELREVQNQLDRNWLLVQQVLDRRETEVTDAIEALDDKIEALDERMKAAEELLQ